PNIIANVIEPAVGILGDVWKRRVLVLGGGVVFAGAALLVAVSGNFWALFLAFTLLSPASGAFVGLSQAALMDYAPKRHEQNMARWTLAGSVGVVAGPLALGGAIGLGLGWRGLFLAFGALTLGVLVVARRFPFPTRAAPPEEPAGARVGLRGGIQAALRSLRRRDVLRWLTLLEFSDLMLDILYGFLALYMVDVVGITPAQAGLAIAVWTGVGLLGDLLLIPLLERVQGLTYLRWSAWLELLLYPAFLLA
ncbi:MAG: MFS transporter, partial [Deltaproteobacteria bacterium]|nr:MFS transporter [Deltaproteobacteria bacterium]